MKCHCRAGGATAVLLRWRGPCTVQGGHGGVAAIPLRIGPTRGGTAEVLNMFNGSAVPPRRSAVLTVSAVLRQSMAEPLRNHGDHGGGTVPLRYIPYRHRSGTVPPV